MQPQADEQAVLANDDLLDQQLDDPLLLGREQLVPQRVKFLEGLPHVVLGRAAASERRSCLG